MKLGINKNSIFKIVLHLIFWLLVWLFFSYFYSFNSDNESYVKWFALILMPITIANTYLSIYYLIPKYLMLKRYFLFILYEIYLLIGTAYVLSILMFFGFVYLSDLDFKQMPPMGASLPFILISMYMVVFIVSAFTLLQYYYTNLEQKKALENKFLATQLKLKEEELKFLKMQIHPHFLFNTLNTLYGFALKKSDQTPELVLKLSNLLDYILYQTEKPLVSISEEIKHIQDYIGLEEMRFSDTLNIQFETDIIDPNLQISPMLLMPFVENGFKHGVPIDDQLSIHINLKTDNKQLLFTMVNSSINKQTNTNGIGLDNVIKRLDLLYLDNYELSTGQELNEFKISLKINIHEQTH